MINCFMCKLTIACSLGVNPQAVRGSRTGVFIGCSISETHEAWSNSIDHLAGYEMTGGSRSMFANRLSYFFDFKGETLSYVLVAF